MENGDWFDKIIMVAIESRTSDIHFEPQRDALVIRFRVDGILRVGQTYQKDYQNNILSKVKVLANMNIAEHRLPQDGHFEYTHGDKIYNIRVSSYPTLYGEAIVMRLLNRDDVLIKLENLGFLPDQLGMMQQLISNTSGMVLTTGPTGSGKTNLLYSILNTLNKPEINIITIEDPIEYEIARIRQGQINDDIGMTFAKSMRTIVRQDPNIIMVGEIRDPETAQIALQASLTGIFVFSTFHTFDIPALVNRLLEMGATPAVIAQAIVGVVATRLVRKICESCKVPYEQADLDKLPEYAKRSLDLHALTPTMKKGRGCQNCSNMGYKGRTGIFEIVFFDNDIKSLITERQPTNKIYSTLVQKHTKSLHLVAKEKILAGITTPEEILRVLGARTT
jgi:type II secretory ATPase GspE/PulE/Tfp pilus assembly ATPase PilB-like protein